MTSFTAGLLLLVFCFYAGGIIIIRNLLEKAPDEPYPGAWG